MLTFDFYMLRIKHACSEKNASQNAGNIEQHVRHFNMPVESFTC